jgi:hypothetical protein
MPRKGANNEQPSDSTMASRAGFSSRKDLIDLVKLCPHLRRSALIPDWKRFKQSALLCGIEEKEAIRALPLVLEDSLATTYNQTLKVRSINSYKEAKKILMELTGLERVKYSDFVARKFNAGRETIRGFYYELQGIAATLDIPQGLIKAQFIAGLPEQLATKVRPFQLENTSCDELVELAERFLKEDEKQVALCCQEKSSSKQNPDELVNVVKQLSEEVAALKANREGNGRVTCFKCGKLGHISRECRSKEFLRRSTPFGSNNYSKPHYSKNSGRPVNRPAEY